jgi:hypothetical protein
MAFRIATAENSDRQESRQVFLSRWTRLANALAFRRAIRHSVCLCGPPARLHERSICLTPGGRAAFGSTEFRYGCSADVAVFLNGWGRGMPRGSQVKERWLLHQEPPPYIDLRGEAAEELTSRFSRVYTCHPRLLEQGRNFIPSPPFVHWLTGYGYDFLRDQREPPKRRGLSIVGTGTANLPGHAARSAFISDLCESGLDFDLYGSPEWSRYAQYRGPLGPLLNFERAPPTGSRAAAPQKWDVYAPSKYALVIENHAGPYYWSEKITDAFLAFCIPIYHGCTNIADYFPAGSFIRLESLDKRGIAQVHDIVRSDDHHSRRDQLLEARRRVLTTHNLFAFLDAEVGGRGGTARSAAAAAPIIASSAGGVP